MNKRSRAAIILAAGGSFRMGKPKQLIQIEGKSLLRRTALLAVETSCSPVVVVLGSNAEVFESELHGLDVDVARNEKWATGMASSVRCGLNAVLLLDPSVTNLLVLVCDQLKVNLTVLKSLLKKHETSGAMITASTYAGTKGVPAIFSREVFSELAAMQGDEGARRIIATYEGHVECVDFPGGADDIDTVEDLLKTNLE